MSIGFLEIFYVFLWRFSENRFCIEPYGKSNYKAIYIKSKATLLLCRKVGGIIIIKWSFSQVRWGKVYVCSDIAAEIELAAIK